MRLTTGTRAPIWSQLEALGHKELAMRERINTLRAVANAHGGPLSAKKKVTPVEERVVSLLERIADGLDRPREPRQPPEQEAAVNPSAGEED